MLNRIFALNLCSQQRKTELQRAASSGSLIMRDQCTTASLNGAINSSVNAQQIITSESTTMPSITSPMHSQYVHQQQQHSPEFNSNMNTMRPRTSSNASSIAGFECDSFQFRDRSASNASSCGGNVGVTGHLSPPSFADYPEHDSITSRV